MLFSSMTFIYLFLPLVLLAYFPLRTIRAKNTLLLAASMLFYAWGGIGYAAVMAFVIAASYAGAIAIETTARPKLALAATIAADLACLFYFKYLNFVVDNANSLFGTSAELAKIALPIGISFYTFQAMSYVFDVYRGGVKAERSLARLALYISLFPQLVAGPIVKYHDVADQIGDRASSFGDIAYGAKRFIAGLAKKVLVANAMGEIADKVFAQQIGQFGASSAWLGALAYSMQLFYDFSGYSDMAIGLGRIFGFRFLENFDHPYVSKSIAEFWRRWHISLSAWFREYLYFPLGGSRAGAWKTYRNLAVVFLATGIWHGAEWTFVIWGIWHGLFIILERLTGWRDAAKSWPRRVLQHIYVLLVVMLGWVVFRAPDIAYAYGYIETMFGLSAGREAYSIRYYLDNAGIIAAAAAFLCSAPLFAKILEVDPARRIRHALADAWFLLLFALASASVASSTYNPFIYFRF
ncbi:MAG: MBOAT family protein [Rickettsiales bacterium]|jgi:alginate O-acetyltransferase complex protein AlgI|nr:MBOAT family protein [Rickettsiales bacterium]